MDATNRPKRKKLPHDIPSWVPDHSKFFITINLDDRGSTKLVKGETAKCLLESIHTYEVAKKWYMHIMVIMPDHVHMIASLSNETGLRSLIKSWKSYFARTLALKWQEGFFDHRLRTENEYFAKRDYVRMNPVRKGLVDDWQDWPHRWER